MQAVVGPVWKAVVDRVWMAVVVVVEEPVAHSVSTVQKAVPGMVLEQEQQELRVELRDPDWLGCWGSLSLTRKSRSVRSVRSARLVPVDRRMRQHCRSHHQAQA